MSVTTVSFDPDKKRIEDIFDGSLQLVIPRYQRTYSWSKDKVEEFYDDFLIESAKAEDNLAFLGTILFAISDDGTLEVIDGQQRLITITIFFSALRDILLNELRSPNANLAANLIQNKIKITSTFGSSYSGSEENKNKLQVGIEILDIFNSLVYEPNTEKSYLKPKNSAEKKVLDGYDFFNRKLKETLTRPGLNSENALKIADRLLAKINGIEYIDIRVTNKEVAYNLFESHNAKGVALAKTDLIKNYYFGRLSGSDNDKNRKMDEWDNLLEILNNKTSNMFPDRFFYYMLQSYDGNFSSSSLYRNIKPKMLDPIGFFKILRTNVTLMIDLKNSSTGDRDIDRSLSALNERLKVNQCFILLLTLQRNKEKLSTHQYRKIVLLIEEFTYIYSGVAKNPGNALEKIYSKHAKDLENELKDIKIPVDKIVSERITGRLLRKLKNDLIDLKPAYAVFLESFADLSYSDKSGRDMIRYTFEKIENHYSRGMVDLGSTFSLDHIIPQSKAKGVLFHSIGNITPMSRIANSVKGAKDAGAESYIDIDNFYSVKLLNEQLQDGNFFDMDAIKSRTNYLAQYAYDHAFGSELKS